MSQITSFKSADFTALRNDIAAALEAVGAKHGISFALGSISYNDQLATTKMTMRVGADKDRVDIRDDKLAQDFKRYHVRFKILSLEETYTIRGREYTIVGYNPRGRNYPLVLKAVKDGKCYKFSLIDVMDAAVAKARKQ